MREAASDLCDGRLVVSHEGGYSPDVVPFCGLIAQAKTRREEFPDRFYTALVFDPDGRIVLRHHKNAVFTPEGTTTPHDVYERWIERFGTPPSPTAPEPLAWRSP